MIKFNKEEYNQWQEFREVKNNSIHESEQKLIAELHAKYFKHKYYLPCGCSPKQWNKWIQQLNEIYANGYTNDTQI